MQRKQKTGWEHARQVPPRETQYAAHEAATTRNEAPAIVLTNDRRSYLAHLVYPRLSLKDAGIRVADDIRSNPQLHLRMRQAGYVPRRVGYTPEQQRILLDFYKLNFYKQ